MIDVLAARSLELACLLDRVCPVAAIYLVYLILAYDFFHYIFANLAT